MARPLRESRLRTWRISSARFAGGGRVSRRTAGRTVSRAVSSGLLRPLGGRPCPQLAGTGPHRGQVFPVGGQARSGEGRFLVVAEPAHGVQSGLGLADVSRTRATYRRPGIVTSLLAAASARAWRANWPDWPLGESKRSALRQA